MSKPFNEEDDEDMFVTLALDNDESIECKILTIFEANDQDYIVLLPLDEDGNESEDGEVYIYRYFEDKDGNPRLENIEDDDEFEIVSDKFDEILDDLEFDEMDD